MLAFFVYFLLLALCSSDDTTLRTSSISSIDDSLTTRTTSLGSLIGKRHVTERGTIAYLYLGVPFAEPPIDQLRYRRPVAKKQWNGVYNATEYKVRSFASDYNEFSLHVNRRRN